MKSKPFGWMQRLLRWWFGAPFQELPEEFGDTVPAEWRVFEAEAEDIRRQPQGRVSPLAGQPGQGKSAAKRS